MSAGAIQHVANESSKRSSSTRSPRNIANESSHFACCVSVELFLARHGACPRRRPECTLQWRQVQDSEQQQTTRLGCSRSECSNNPKMTGPKPQALMFSFHDSTTTQVRHEFAQPIRLTRSAARLHRQSFRCSCEIMTTTHVARNKETL